jgi:ATP-dependent DNA helicase RecQ
MVGYAETAGCRHDHILHYFEDEAEELGGCGHCDNCRAIAAGERTAEPDEQASVEVVGKALAALRAMPFAVGSNVLISYLMGDASRQIERYDWQRRPDFGLLRERREMWLRHLLRRFVAAGLLAVGTDKATLHITRRAVDVINGARPNPVRLPDLTPNPFPGGKGSSRSAGTAEGAIRSVCAGRSEGARPGVVGPAAGLDGDGMALFARLKAWRTARADADNVPAYVILTDATLRLIADARPETRDDLLVLSGIGPAKLERYGSDVLAEVASQMSGTPMPGAAIAEQAAREERPPAAVDPVLAAMDVRNGRRAINFSAYQLEVRQQHARAFERWSDEEDELVRAHAGSGDGPEQIAGKLQRQPTSIRIRMEKLGLIEPPEERVG